MQKVLMILCIVALLMSSYVYAADKAMAPSHGIAYPTGWQNWATIAVSHRTDNSTLSVIIGNDVAVNAARSGNTNPWPDGAVIGKVVWNDTQLSNWKAATAPGKFVHAEFMFKDAKKYIESYGWGWARWIGLEQQQPFEKGMNVCISCHTPVKKRDWVFTEPVSLPK